MMLALDGGNPVWVDGWPAWPRVTDTLDAALAGVARSGRWAVSGDWAGASPLDIELAKSFAEYSETRYCLPVDHGSSALVVGLLGLGVRAGDEVVVPGMTWVATASAVARLGARPILVDIDPDTMCLDPDAVEAAVTPRTRAVVAVHLYSAMADMDRLRDICRTHDLGLLEDCAQAYGARWGGRPAGSLGDAGAFSAQQGKALTSGEGGLFVTSREDLYELAEMYRGDGRRYFATPPPVGRPSLQEHAVVQGWNMHLSEFQAAILLDALKELPQLDESRRDGAAYLDDAIRTTLDDDLELVHPHPKNDVRGYYHYAVRLRPERWSDVDVRVVCAAISAELGLHAHVTYPPLDDHALFDPRRLPSRAGEPPWLLDPTQFDLPRARHESRRTVLVHHSVLLSPRTALDAVVEAFTKVGALRGSLRGRDLA